MSEFNILTKLRASKHVAHCSALMLPYTSQYSPVRIDGDGGSTRKRGNGICSSHLKCS